jgi:hypothetical protein
MDAARYRQVDLDYIHHTRMPEKTGQKSVRKFPLGELRRISKKEDVNAILPLLEVFGIRPAPSSVCHAGVN